MRSHANTAIATNQNQACQHICACVVEREPRIQPKFTRPFSSFWGWGLGTRLGTIPCMARRYIYMYMVPWYVVHARAFNMHGTGQSMIGTACAFSALLSAKTRWRKFSGRVDSIVNLLKSLQTPSKVSVQCVFKC